MNKSIILLTALFFLSCQKKIDRTVLRSEIKPNIKLTKDENEDLKYEVLNQIIQDEMIEQKNLLKNNLFDIGSTSFRLQRKEDENEDAPRLLSEIPLEYDSVFSTKDSAFYRSQTEIDRKFKFEKSKISVDLPIITQAELWKFRENNAGDFWTNFNKKYPDKCIKYFSQPYFNKEKNACVVNISESCGPLSGSGAIVVYQKINGKWTAIKSLDSWVS